MDSQDNVDILTESSIPAPLCEVLRFFGDGAEGGADASNMNVGFCIGGQE